MPMTKVPVNIIQRPYSIYPPTNLMNPDGFFISNLGMQFIEAQIFNESENELTGVNIYIEAFSDPNIQPYLEYKFYNKIPPKASFPVRFLVDFSNATAGKPLVSIIVESSGFEYNRIITKIFVTNIQFDRTNKTFTVHAPEGRMLVKIEECIVDLKRSKCCGKYDSKSPSIILPTKIYQKWIPDPPYLGMHGPLPYDDPWWKVLVFLALFLAFLGIAALYDYFSDGTLDGGSVSVSGGDIPPAPPPPNEGDYADNVTTEMFCCEEIISKIPKKSDEINVGASGNGDWIEMGLYAAAGPAAGVIAAQCDFEDLHFRGQEQTNPSSNEWTLSEEVKTSLKYLEAPALGKKYSIGINWEYTRNTSQNNYDYNNSEAQDNTHYLESYKVEVPAIHDRRTGPLVVKARFQNTDGKYYKAESLYVFGVLVSTYEAVRFIEMSDHGVAPDERASDTWYTGEYLFKRRIHHKPEEENLEEEDLPGTWYLFVFAQDVNTATDKMDPIEAAKIIGGIVVTPQMELSFDDPCTLEYDAIIQVV